jgi:hypothetical protein
MTINGQQACDEDVPATLRVELHENLPVSVRARLPATVQPNFWGGTSKPDCLSPPSRGVDDQWVVSLSMQHRLYFLPLPHGQDWLAPTLTRRR